MILLNSGKHVLKKPKENETANIIPYLVTDLASFLIK